MTLSQSQNQATNEELIVMTKDKHEALRRDVEDYKVLLMKYSALREELEMMVSDLERQSKFLSKNKEALMDARRASDKLEDQLNAAQIKIESLETKNTEISKDYSELARGYRKEKAKVIRLQKDNKGLWIWKLLTVFFFLAMLLVGGNS